MNGHEPSQIKLGAFGEKFEDGRMMCDYDTGVDLYVMFDFEVLVSVDGKPPFFAAGSERISSLACRAGVSELFDGGRRLRRKKTLYKYGVDVDLRLTSTPISSSSSPSDNTTEAEPWETYSLEMVQPKKKARTSVEGSTSSGHR